MKHRQYCSRLGIKTFEDLEWGAFQQPQVDTARAPQAPVQHGERGVSVGGVEEIPNEGTVSTLVQKDWEVAAERQKIIAEQGKVVIAEEEIDRINYALVKEKDKVRILYGNSDIAGYKRIIGPEADSIDLSPLTHLDLLLEAAAGGVDKFKEDVVRMSRAESECPELDLVIWLFEVEGSRTEIRCDDIKGERLRRKLNMDSLDALMARVNTRAPQTPKAQPPPATIQLNTPPSSRQPSPQQHRSEHRSPSVLPSVEDATQSTPAKLYTPCLDGKEYHHIATHLPGKNQVKQDDTPCIVQVGNTEEFRLWTWKDVQELGAKLCAVRKHPGKQDSEVAPCAREWQFHEPDKNALGVIKQLGGFANIKHKVHATLTRWNAKEKKPFTNSVLVSIADPEVWGKVINARKTSNYNYEGPLRCSISEFQANGGKLKAAMAAVQRDTEGGEEFYKYKHNPKDERGLTPRGKSREWTPVDTDTVDELDKLRLAFAELVERVALLENKTGSPVEEDETY
ncbi:hypothetical protein HBI68_253810 [Parastagonospora nodorum]|nr:hypothetical protein HBI68_253810 [Parastagonospora nodorum]KAH6383968.1 hypothetical protein HBI60_252440 [Parastagonospora nodorum]